MLKICLCAACRRVLWLAPSGRGDQPERLRATAIYAEQPGSGRPGANGFRRASNWAAASSNSCSAVTAGRSLSAAAVLRTPANAVAAAGRRAGDAPAGRCQRTCASRVRPKYEKQLVDITARKPGTIIVDAQQAPVPGRDARALRYWRRPPWLHRVGSGGFREKEWPAWTPAGNAGAPGFVAHGRYAKSARRPRDVSGIVALPHPRFEKALDLHQCPSAASDAQRGRRPLWRVNVGAGRRDLIAGSLKRKRPPAWAAVLPGYWQKAIRRRRCRRRSRRNPYPYRRDRRRLTRYRTIPSATNCHHNWRGVPTSRCR